MKKYLPILVVLALAFVPLPAFAQQQDGQQQPQQQAGDGEQQAGSGEQQAQGGRQQAGVQAEITITQEQPQVTVRQQPPEITIVIPRPIVTITIPEPQVDIQMPEPRVSVRQPEPDVQVTMGELQVEPAQAEGAVRPQQRGQAQVRIEQEEPRIRIQQEEPEIRITRTGRQQGQQEEQAQGQQAQAARQPQPQQPSQQQQQQETTIRLTRLRDTRVVGPQGRQVGMVQDAWLTGEGEVSHLVLELQQGIGGLQPGSYLAPPRALLMQGDGLMLRQAQGLERLEGQGRPPQVARSSVPVSRLLEYRLIGSDGGQLGRIEDVVVDARQGRVIYAAVAFEGGQLGARQRLVAVPYSDIRYDLGEGTVTLDVTRRQLEQAPADIGFTQDDWPASASRQWSRLLQQGTERQAR